LLHNSRFLKQYKILQSKLLFCPLYSAANEARSTVHPLSAIILKQTSVPGTVPEAPAISKPNNKTKAANKISVFSPTIPFFLQQIQT
jgi:hypothetical protein